jgi:glycosyltransferase involved in cell wall biosynthesis
MKRPNSVGYFSAYYRGLECLIDLWPQISAEVPDATLDIYYGWQSWVSAEGEDSFYHRMTAKLDAVKDMGVTEHGRVSHTELAKAMNEIEVWAYPTQFEEIHCITALKANAAGCKPVITDVAALKETGGPNATYIESARIYSDDYAKSKFVKEVVRALKFPQSDADREAQTEWAKAHDWINIAELWKETINE